MLSGAAGSSSGEPAFKLSPPDGRAWVSLDRWQKLLRLSLVLVWQPRLVTTGPWRWRVEADHGGQASW